jgi:hypothetical protein
MEKNNNITLWKKTTILHYGKKQQYYIMEMGWILSQLD